MVGRRRRGSVVVRPVAHVAGGSGRVMEIRFRRGGAPLPHHFVVVGGGVNLICLLFHQAQLFTGRVCGIPAATNAFFIQVTTGGITVALLLGGRGQRPALSVTAAGQTIFEGYGGGVVCSPAGRGGPTRCWLVVGLVL